MAKNTTPRYRSLSISFHRKHALRAVELAPKCDNRRELRDRLMSSLRQPSQATRRRVANKLIQRYAAGPEGRLQVTPFIELVGGIRDRTSRTQLLYYRLTQVDELVGGLAREIVYPYFIQRRVPKGFKRDEFFAINGQRLFDENPYVLPPFVEQFAERNWGFTRRESLGEAQRILADSGLVARRRIRSVFRHPFALFPAKTDLTMTTFLYALYDEFGDAEGTLTEERLVDSMFARTLLASPHLIRNMIVSARRYGYLRQKRKTGELTLTYGSLQAAVADLKETAV